MSDLNFVVMIGGHVVPASKFTIVGGAYGSVGHLTLTTTFTMLYDIKLNIFELTSGSPGLVEVSVDVQQLYTPPPSTGGYDGSPRTSRGVGAIKRIFGGEYLRTEYSLDNDTVTITARDWAGVLVDQKRVLTKIGKAIQQVLAPLVPGRVTVQGISNENQKVSQIINSIADEFGFKAVLHLSDDGRDPTVGTLYGSQDQSFITVPQSLWTILNQLARDTGYDVYVTPARELVFGEPGVGLDTLNFSWNVVPQSGQYPCKQLRLEHHPRRNSTFRCLVISYDPTKAQTTLGRATYIGANYAGQHGITAGLSTGQAAVTTDANIAALRLSVSQIPLYTFHIDGLTTEQATLKAQSIAMDIAKKQLILRFTIDGIPYVLPTQMVRLNGDMPKIFSEPIYYISGYEQEFTMPGASSHGGDSGWTTRITALNIPTEGLAKGEEG